MHILVQRLREEKLYANFSKCELWVDYVAFLGNVVSKEGIRVDSVKIKAVMDYKKPTLVTEV